jgi:hypothetical protein
LKQPSGRQQGQHHQQRQLDSPAQKKEKKKIERNAKSHYKVIQGDLKNKEKQKE